MLFGSRVYFYGCIKYRGLKVDLLTSLLTLILFLFSLFSLFLCYFLRLFPFVDWLVRGLPVHEAWVILSEEILDSSAPTLDSSNVFRAFPYILLTIPDYEKHRLCTSFPT